ncbi:MAG: galactose oxidase, partial [Paraburkholderia sp.]|uniref:hypothetical protein n=1 Tax=Paraburkholderia sp. TaxID=1926495 RepID=UPI002AFEAEAE
MAPIRFIRGLSQLLDRCGKVLLLIAFTSSLGAFSGLAHAQAVATIKLSGTNVCLDVNAESKKVGA